MKLALIKILGKTITIVSWILIVLSVLGALALVFPDYMEFLKEVANFNEVGIMSFALGSGGLGAMGVVGKSLKNSFNTENALLVARHNAEMELWKKEKDQLQISQNDFMVEFTKQNAETHQVLKKTDEKLDLSLLFQIAYAEERLNMSDSLVPPEVKNTYKAFLDGVNAKNNVDNKTLDDIEIITLSETIEKTVEVPITNKEKRLRNKKELQEIKESQGVGLR